MRGGYCATRRFYHAFYRWHILNTAAPRPKCRALSSTPSRSAGNEPSGDAFGVQPSRRGMNNRIKRLDLESSNHSKQRQDDEATQRLNKIAARPILTSTEKPFDTLTEWEEVVRYKSEDGLLLQLAVPFDQLREAQEVHGKGLEGLQQRFGCRVEVGATFGDLISVTLSGTFREVGHIRVVLDRFRAAPWINVSPRSQAEMPSASLKLWDVVVRASDGVLRELETMVTGEEAAEASRLATLFQRRHNVQLDMPADRVFPGDGAEAAKHSIVISGARMNVLRAYSGLGNIFKEHRGKPRPEDYTSPTASFPTCSDADAIHFRNAKPGENLYLLLRIPEVPNVQRQPAAGVIGKGAINILEMSAKFNVTCRFAKRNTRKFTITGATEDRLRRAAGHLQMLLDRACRGDGLEPVELEELKRGRRPDPSLEDGHRAQDASPPINGPSAVAANNATAEQPRTHIEPTTQTRTGDSQNPPPSRHFAVSLEVPRGPNGEDTLLRHLSGNRGSIVRDFHAKNKMEGPERSIMRIYGPDEAEVRRAAVFAQEVTDDACRTLGIPPTKLREVKTHKIGSAPMPAQSSRVGATNQHSLEKHNEPPTVSTEDMKLALGALTHPVVLVTSQVPNKLRPFNLDDLLFFCRGVTVSSFNSITLEPTPLISFNIKTPSRTWDAIQTSGQIAAHILQSSSSGAALAHAFTQKHARPDEPFWQARRLGAHVEVREPLIGNGKFLPLITLRGGVLRALKATVMLEKCVQVGDHVIVVAEVRQIRWSAYQDGVEGRESVVDAEGLAYARRGYRGVGQQIKVAGIPDAVAAGTPEVVDDAALTVRELEEHDNEVGASVAEEGQGKSSPPVSIAQSHEETEIDYFAAVQDGDYDAGTDSSDDEALQGEVERDDAEIERAEFEVEEAAHNVAEAEQETEAAEHNMKDPAYRTAEAGDATEVPLLEDENPAEPENTPLVEDSAAANGEMSDGDGDADIASVLRAIRMKQRAKASEGGSEG